jgi:rubrerythrin
MDEFGNDVAILELAISREEDANKFFLIMAARAERPEMRKVFEELADEELEHKSRLELEVMKSGRVVTATEKTELNVGTDAETSVPKLDMDYKDMLILCMQKEESSFRLYVDLAARVSSEEAYETLVALAEEEVKHKMRFEMEYENLLKTK